MQQLQSITSFFVRYSILILLIISFSVSQAQSQNKYQFTIDLVNVSNDQVSVELQCPQFNQDVVRYSLPKIVPGTYSIYDFGRFIENFTARDKDGMELAVTHDDVNTWTINNANRLSKISYNVNDSYDAHDKDNPIFEPAGSNTQTDSNYVLNTFAYLGYFENHENDPYELTILHKPGFYGSTAMTDEDASSSSDRFTKPNYHEIADNPLMYNVPDTATVQVGNCTVLISVYGPSGNVPASYIAGKMDTLLQAQGKYLGGTLPVNKYAFIIYLDNDEGISGGQGALEHSYCSMYYMPELPKEAFISYFTNFAAHEFFHIITPLNIHSEEIQYFDFSHPKMSEHLWLYEGTTEYHAHLVQEKYKLISPEDFLETISEKMTTAAFGFNDTLPFTELSKGCLDRYKDQYINVYMKGALIGMCLDIRLRALSNGSYGIQNLMHDLSKEYGKQHPFKDDELFDKIGALTYPQITDFLKQYVAGSLPLPFEETFKIVGVNYAAVQSYKSFSLGRISLSVNPATGLSVIEDISTMNDFGRVVGYRVGDEIVSINGTKILPHNFVQFRNTWLATVKDGDPFKVVVNRPKPNGKYKKVTLKTHVFQTDAAQYNLLSFSENPTPSQLAIRNAWLNP
ncbi:MAG TPA: peptidase M61 [Chitinophagales bacterium]|nr:peptidase M61 [Chitinophagales bacterium]